MSNPYFQFKQFTVWHDRCAMKVGTDAVLLGSWVRVEDARQMLDIGTGCGLIALMAAQRSGGEVCAVEIDADAACQARENVMRSPWVERIRVVNADILTFASEVKYDAIFSNPPYFVDSLKCPDSKRAVARHTDGLDFESLMRCASRLLATDGEFSLVVPMEAVETLKATATSCLLYLSRETRVQTKAGAPPKRALLAFTPTAPSGPPVIETLVMQESPGKYSDRYLQMVRDFYLNL